MLKPFDPMTCFTIVTAGFIVACICHQSHKHHHKVRFWIEYVKFRYRLKRLEHKGALECPKHCHRASGQPLALAQSSDYIKKFLDRALGNNECAARKLAHAVYKETKTVSTKGRCAAACSSDLVRETTRKRVGNADLLRETIAKALHPEVHKGHDDDQPLDGEMSTAMRAVIDHSHGTNATAGK